MNLVYLFVGLAVGVIIGWLINKLTVQKNDSNYDADLIEGKARLEQRVQSAEEELDEKKQLLLQERESNANKADRLARSEEAFRHQEERLELQKLEIEELNKRLTTEFENIATRIIRQNSEEITKLNNDHLKLTLQPLGSHIKAFQEKIDKNAEERNTLRGEIKALIDLNQQMSEEAKNLTNALKGDNKQQGNWGEVVMERILEDSGLEKGREYKLEVSTENNSGDRIRPDAVVYLPDNKHVIIDSKVSLIGYQAFVAADNEDERKVYAKNHVESIKTHIKALSDKSYQTSLGLNTPDFVLMFMPIEPAFGVALQTEPELFSFAWDRKIVVVSPTTLLATLRTIASIWKQEKQTRNAIEIARQGGALYDKFVGFVDELKIIRKYIDQTSQAYDKAWNKLSSGTGNLIGRAEKIKALGAKTSKNLEQQDNIERTNEA